MDLVPGLNHGRVDSRSVGGKYETGGVFKNGGQIEHFPGVCGLQCMLTPPAIMSPENSETPRSMILIMGRGGLAGFDERFKEEGDRLETIMEREGIATIKIGSGDRDVSDAELVAEVNYHFATRPPDEDWTAILHAHGDILGMKAQSASQNKRMGHHVQLRLDEATRTRSVLETITSACIANTTQGSKNGIAGNSGVFTFVCHGDENLKNADALPEGCMLTSVDSGLTRNTNFQTMLASMEAAQRKGQRLDLSPGGILDRFMVHGIANRQHDRPGLSVSRTSPPDSSSCVSEIRDLHQEYLDILGTQFSRQETKEAQTLFGSLASKDKIDETLAQISTGRDSYEYSVDAANYGLALAMCSRYPFKSEFVRSGYIFQSG